MSRSEKLGAAAAIGAVLWVAAVPWLLPADELVYRWLQFHWNEWADRAIVLVDGAVRISLGAIVVLALLSGAWRRPPDWLAASALVGSGAVVGEFLKTAVERLRPESLPTYTFGNSLPSGHVMNTTLIALAACHLTRAAGWRPWRKRAAGSIAAACVAGEAVCRLGREAHWFSDLPASVLLGAAWYLGAPALRWLSISSLACCAAFFLGAFVALSWYPSIRVRLPSVIDEQPGALASVDFGEADARLPGGGTWQDGLRELVGPVSWAMSREVTLEIDEAGGRPAVMKVLCRPQSCGVENQRANTRLIVSVNGWEFPGVMLRRGWREYHLEPPPDVLRPGKNVVSFRIEGQHLACAAGVDPGYAAFRYLRFYPSGH